MSEKQSLEIPECVKLSPSAVTLWRLLQSGKKLDKWSFSKASGCSLHTATYWISMLITNNLVSICDWVRKGDRGPHSPVICKKTTRNKAKPVPLSNAEILRRYRKKHLFEVREMDKSYRLRKKLTCDNVDFKTLNKALYK